MTFIEVTADQCTSQGAVLQGRPRSTFRIHKDLIGIIMNQEVFPKAGNILNAGGNAYTNIKLTQNIPLDNL